MTKFAIDLGHGCAFDGGAVGIETEEFLINSAGNCLIEKLMRLRYFVRETPTWKVFNEFERYTKSQLTKKILTN